MSTFSLALESVEEVSSYPVLISQFENGDEDRRLIHPNKNAVWSLKSPALTYAQAQDYRDFFDARYGAYESFEWTCPLDGETYIVRMVTESFKTVLERGYYRCSFQFERVHNG